EDQRRSKQIARDAEIARIHAEEELQIKIDGLDRNNETIAKYLQEYHQFAKRLKGSKGKGQDLSRKGRIIGNKMHKAFPLPGIEFPLAEEVPTTSEEGSISRRKEKPLPGRLHCYQSPEKLSVKVK
nr:hypothetical protein [Tanacetum cinerariifolium]